MQHLKKAGELNEVHMEQDDDPFSLVMVKEHGKRVEEKEDDEIYRVPVSHDKSLLS